MTYLESCCIWCLGSWVIWRFSFIQSLRLFFRCPQLLCSWRQVVTENNSPVHFGTWRCKLMGREASMDFCRAPARVTIISYTCVNSTVCYYVFVICLMLQNFLRCVVKLQCLFWWSPFVSYCSTIVKIVHCRHEGFMFFFVVSCLQRCLLLVLFSCCYCWFASCVHFVQCSIWSSVLHHTYTLCSGVL